MKSKLLPTLISALLLGQTVVSAQTPAPPPQPQIEVNPTVAVAPEVNVVMPGFRFEMPEIAIPPINIDLPDIEINGGDFWYDEEERTEREELKQSYPLTSGARVELTNIDGPVRIEPTDAGQAEVRILSYSSSANPRRLTVESAGNSLTIRNVESRLNTYNGTSHSVTLKLPRRVELTINDAHDSVHIGDFEGPLHLNGVSGSVGAAQVVGAIDMTRVSGSVVANVARLGAGGVRVERVSGSVSLRFMDELNAELQTTGIKGKVYVEVPNVAVQGEMKSADFRAKIGAGGPTVTISDVSGSVRLAHGRTVSELLEDMKTSTRSATRMQTVRDLALHVAQPQVRAALIEALQTDQSNAVAMTAAHALVPYVSEPEVRAVFIKTVDSSRSNETRTTALRALARTYAGDRTVRDLLLRALASDKSNLARQMAAGALAKYLDDADVLRALMTALRNDENAVVRLRATGALAKKVENEEVYALLVEKAKTDSKKMVRARALDALSPRLRERADLRPLFIGYLDDESLSLEYHALKGLVELNDPALKQRLVDKSRDLILSNGSLGWNNNLVLDTLLLLRKLDPQESDRALAELGAQRDGNRHF